MFVDPDELHTPMEAISMRTTSQAANADYKLFDALKTSLGLFQSQFKFEGPHSRTGDSTNTVVVTRTGRWWRRALGSSGYIIRWTKGEQLALDVVIPDGTGQVNVHPADLSELQAAGLIDVLAQIIRDNPSK